MKTNPKKQNPFTESQMQTIAEYLNMPVEWSPQGHINANAQGLDAETGWRVVGLDEAKNILNEGQGKEE